jgi:hypothetical protein
LPSDRPKQHSVCNSVLKTNNLATNV